MAVDGDDAEFVSFVQDYSNDDASAPRKFRVVATGTMMEQSMKASERDGSYHLRNFPLTRDQVMDLLHDIDIDPDRCNESGPFFLTTCCQIFFNSCILTGFNR